ncbi:MAG: hypothetical protein F2799_01105 [Actinobacteria bacterium]|uniref:Unannotated protein n=1 Tax=freshwater metagenome TaxID=449393 RepID=A0A6J7D3U6_9ZZZZ|nr:hypothetical protein [Actinomycetota bacterium]
MTAPRTTAVAVSLTCILALALASGAIAGESWPASTISSTKGSGANGCVGASKTLRFTSTPTVFMQEIRSMRVWLAGKVVATGDFTGMGVKSMVRTISLRGLSAGSHLIQLSVYWDYVPPRRGRDARPAGVPLPFHNEYARIRHCAAARPKPHYTG